MRIVVSGGSGFIGTPLVQHLVGRGDEVTVLSRNPDRVKIGRGVQWNPPNDGAWTAEIASADAVVNLAGENIGEGRWTAERKRKLVSSRLDSTYALVDAMRRAPSQSRAFVSASAIGFYGDRGDELIDESGHRGSGFLAELSEKWEEAARQAEPVSRTVILRFGVVLEESGGALGKMLLPFRLGAGGRVGSGKQWMSWVDREDVIRAIEWTIDTREAHGVYNVTAPAPVRNSEFTKALGSALHRPAIMPVPAIGLKLAFGEMAEEVLLAGQRVVPNRLIAAGFRFQYPSLEESLARML